LISDKLEPFPQIKLLTPKGVCLIKYGTNSTNSSSELVELVKSSIYKNSVATLGTRSIFKVPDISEQLKMVDSLCKMLNADATSIEKIVTTYINPFCISEFNNPNWGEIGKLLQTKYGYKYYTKTGNTISADDYKVIPKMAKINTRAYLPSAYSLKKYCPAPGNQGDFGTCVGWSTAYGARTISWAIKNNITNTLDITNQAFSPSFIYEMIKQNSDINCSKGVSLSLAVKLLKEKGVPLFNEIGVGCNLDLNAINSNVSDFAIKDYQALTKEHALSKSDEEFEEHLRNIKLSIAEKKPVVASINCYESFYGKIWNGLLDSFRGGHAICIVGYDDQYSNGEGAVEMLNSWGPYWGDGGFIKVKYSDLKKILTSAISLIDDINILPNKLFNSNGNIDSALNKIKESKVKMIGSIQLELRDGSYMPIQTDELGVRGFKLSQIENMTYNVSKAYPSGTLFKIKFTSSLPAYVYVIGSDSKRSPITQLFPDEENNISALLDFKSEVSISIPEGLNYIELDDTVGEDYLCVIYSKNQLDISSIKNNFEKNQFKGFVNIIKESLKGKIVDEKEVMFQKNSMSFEALSLNDSVVPIFIKIKHQ
jgi:C1A family cysteine protease